MSFHVICGLPPPLYQESWLRQCSYLYHSTFHFNTKLFENSFLLPEKAKIIQSAIFLYVILHNFIAKIWLRFCFAQNPLTEIALDFW